jgi:hypothetical protein
MVVGTQPLVLAAQGQAHILRGALQLHQVKM